MSGIILYFNTAIALAVPILMVSIGVCYQEKTGVYGMGSDSSMLKDEKVFARAQGLYEAV